MTNSTTTSTQQDTQEAFYDVAVIGAGPAGMTAALFASRAGLRVLVLERFSPGGQLADTESIENYPGFPEGVGGYELAMEMHAQMLRFGAEVVAEEVLSVDFAGEMKLLVTASGEYGARSVVVASGASPRKLGLKREEALTGRGVSYCATCDGAFFRDRVCVIVGGGNTAAADALYLARICKKVYLVHRRDKLRATALYHKMLASIENLEFVWDSVPIEFLTKDDRLAGMVVENLKTGEMRTIFCEGLFVAVGMTANTGFLGDALELDGGAHVVADESGLTAIPGVYVAGDVRTKDLRQVVTAASDGAIAAEAAAEYLASFAKHSTS